MDLDAGVLIAACSDGSADAGITIMSVLEPLGGPGSPVKPAGYAGGQFQADRRWWGGGADRRPVDVLVIDNEPSQANRLEAAMEQRRAELGLPEIVLDLTSVGALPPHLPGQISSFRFPHRNADAYLRDAMLDGNKFLNTEVGAAIFGATADKPEALLQWFPQALLFGFWQSHLGKRSQAKLARAWTSEIVGVEPAAASVHRLGLKGDPLNLNVADSVDVNPDAAEDWQFSTKGKKLADVGHGQVPFGGAGRAAVRVLVEPAALRGGERLGLQEGLGRRTAGLGFVSGVRGAEPLLQGQGGYVFAHRETPSADCRASHRPKRRLSLRPPLTM